MTQWHRGASGLSGRVDGLPATQAARGRRRGAEPACRTGRVIISSQSAHRIQVKNAPTFESYTCTLARVQKSMSTRAISTPLQKIYNYLCGPDLELKLFTPTLKKIEEALSGIMLSAHAPPPTTEHVFRSSDSAEFILFDFRLFDYL